MFRLGETPRQSHRTSRGRGRLLVASAALLWSTGGLFIKMIPLDGLGVVFWRSLIAAAFLSLAFRPTLQRLRAVSPATVVVYAMMILTFVTATKLTTAANAIFLQYTGPLYVLMLAPILLKEPFQRIDAAAIGVSLAGMSLFFVGKLEGGQLAGNLLGAASGVFFAGVVLLLRRDAAAAVVAGGDAVTPMILGNLLAAAVAAPFAGRLALDLTGALCAVYLGTVQMGVSYLLFVKGLEVTPAAEASLLGMLEPLFNPLFVFLKLGETPSAWASLGGAIVLLAVAGRTMIVHGRERVARRAPA